MPRESYAALAAVTWMGSTRGKKPAQIEASLIKLLDDMHARGAEAEREACVKDCQEVIATAYSKHGQYAGDQVIDGASECITKIEARGKAGHDEG